jgi:HSP20 family protein
MNPLKRWRKSEHGNGRHGRGGPTGGTALAKRGPDAGSRDLFLRLRDEMDHAFERIWKDFGDFGRDPWWFGSGVPALAGESWPDLDVSEDEKAVTYRVEVPGMDEKNLDVEVSGNLLTIRGTREQEQDDKTHGHYERFSGSFARSVTLPDYVDAASLDARYAKGVLTVSVPKVPGKGPRRVKLNVA